MKKVLYYYRFILNDLKFIGNLWEFSTSNVSSFADQQHCGPLPRCVFQCLCLLEFDIVPTLNSNLVSTFILKLLSLMVYLLFFILYNCINNYIINMYIHII